MNLYKIGKFNPKWKEAGQCLSVAGGRRRRIDGKGYMEHFGGDGNAQYLDYG